MTQETKLVKLHCTREQIYVHKCFLVLEVPGDAADEELVHLGNYDLICLPWNPLSEPEYDGEKTDEDRLIIESISEVTNGEHSVNGIVTRDEDGDLVFQDPE